MDKGIMDLNIVCFLWKGDRWNAMTMGVEYVNVLYQSVQRNLTLPHRFVCITDVQDSRFNPGIELLPLVSPSRKGCLPKLSMFNPVYGFKGQVFSIDIDVVITGSLDDMCSYRGPFCTRAKFKPGEEYKMDGDIVGFDAQNPVCHKIWDPYSRDHIMVEKFTGGRERYYYRFIFHGESVDFWQTLYPGQILSYKRHVKGNNPPENARVVSFHGDPKPHQLIGTKNWIKDNWK